MLIYAIKWLVLQRNEVFLENCYALALRGPKRSRFQMSEPQKASKWLEIIKLWKITFRAVCSKFCHMYSNFAGFLVVYVKKNYKRPSPKGARATNLSLMRWACYHRANSILYISNRSCTGCAQVEYIQPIWILNRSCIIYLCARCILYLCAPCIFQTYPTFIQTSTNPAKFEYGTWQCYFTT